MVTFRPARKNEAVEIRKLIWQVGINPIGLNWRRFTVAANDQDQMIGFGQIKPHGKYVFELASLVVKPADRGKGIAAALINELKSNSPRPLYLTCRAGLTAFYQKYGFTELTDPGGMPPYFRKITRFLGWIKKINPRFEGVAVCVLYEK